MLDLVPFAGSRRQMIQALIWAFKPTDIIDIRNLPAEERRETAAMIASLRGKAPAAAPASPPASKD